MFVDELLAAYPNAKVILTERDTESWLVSMENSFYVLLSWKSFYYLAPLGPVQDHCILLAIQETTTDVYYRRVLMRTGRF